MVLTTVDTSLAKFSLQKGIVLRPFNERQDFEWYYRLATTKSSLLRWRFHGAPPAREQFLQIVMSGIHSQFVADLPSSKPSHDCRIGVFTSYSYDPLSRTVYMGAITNEKKNGLGIVASALFIDYLFDTWPLRKVYLELPEFNLVKFKNGLGKYFFEEGRLKDHFYAYGKYWDYLTFAIYKRDYKDNVKIRSVIDRFRALEP